MKQRFLDITSPACSRRSALANLPEDEDKFPDGPWCQEGDFIMMRAYSGTRFKVSTPDGDQEFRLINDDTVEAVVADPRVVTRI